MATLTEKFDELDDLVRMLELSAREVDKALKRSVAKTIRATATLTARETAKDTRTKVALIRNRMKIIENLKSNKAKLSVLTYSIPGILLGRPRKVSNGVSVGGHFFKGAFVRQADRRKGKSRMFIFRRAGSDQYPLREMRVPIADAVDRSFAEMEASLEDRLVKNFEREVKLFGGLFR